MVDIFLAGLTNVLLKLMFPEAHSDGKCHKLLLILIILLLQYSLKNTMISIIKFYNGYFDFFIQFSSYTVNRKQHAWIKISFPSFYIVFSVLLRETQCQCSSHEEQLGHRNMFSCSLSTDSKTLAKMERPFCCVV